MKKMNPGENECAESKEIYQAMSSVIARRRAAQKLKDAAYALSGYEDEKPAPTRDGELEYICDLCREFNPELVFVWYIRAAEQDTVEPINVIELIEEYAKLERIQENHEKAQETGQDQP
jgi:hypothetical protein